MANPDSLLLETQEQDISNTRCVPIVELSKESADHTWPAVVEAIRGASYVALDLVSCYNIYTYSDVPYTVYNYYCSPKLSTGMRSFEERTAAEAPIKV